MSSSLDHKLERHSDLLPLKYRQIDQIPKATNKYDTISTEKLISFLFFSITTRNDLKPNNRQNISTLKNH